MVPSVVPERTMEGAAASRFDLAKPSIVAHPNEDSSAFCALHAQRAMADHLPLIYLEPRARREGCLPRQRKVPNLSAARNGRKGRHDRPQSF